MLEQWFGEVLTERSFANHVNVWLENKEANSDKIEVATKYASWALYATSGQKKHKIGVLFKTPKKLDFFNLVPVETEVVGGVTIKKLQNSHLRHREGFALTDNGASLEIALDDANYCIFCHNQGKDSCSKGLKEKDGAFKKTVPNVPQAGCPLEEKISEMNVLKSRGVADFFSRVSGRTRWPAALTFAPGMTRRVIQQRMLERPVPCSMRPAGFQSPS